MKELQWLSIFIFSLSISNKCSAQVGINSTGAMPNSSAILDASSTRQGFLLPRLSNAQRDSITSPAEGLQIYNLDCHKLNVYNGSAWVDMVGNALVTAPTAGANTPSQTQVVWNWNTVSGATGYKWNTTNNYSTATDMAIAITKIETGLTCNNTYTRYVWTYNNCGISSYTVLTQTTSGCGACNGATTMLDSRDNKVYNIVSIGAQCWMAQNLNYGAYVTVAIGQGGAGTKYCYGNDTAKCTIYGGLYEWANMMNGSASCNGTGAGQPACSPNVQGLCPSGWHIPSHYEWTLLESNVDSTQGVFPYDVSTTGRLGTDEGSRLKEAGAAHWTSGNTGTNTSGFIALPGGLSSAGSFVNVGGVGYWWSTTESGSNAWVRNLNYDNARINRYTDAKTVGFSVRCVKN